MSQRDIGLRSLREFNLLTLGIRTVRVFVNDAGKLLDCNHPVQAATTWSPITFQNFWKKVGFRPSRPLKA